MASVINPWVSPAEVVCYALPEAHPLDVVAEKLGVDERTVRSWIAKGELRAVNLSRDRNSRKPRLRILEDEVDRFLTARTTAANPRAASIAARRPKLPPVGDWGLWQADNR